MTGSKLRIVHVFRAPLGGLFRHVLDLAREQTARGHQVGMFFDMSGMDSRVESAIAAIPGGLQLGLGLAKIGRNPGPSDISAFLQFRRWLAKAQPDVLQGHGAKGGVLARLAGALSPVAVRPVVVYTPHGGSFNYRVGSLAHTVYMAAERALAGSTDLFLFESDFIAGRFSKYVPSVRGLSLCAYNGLRPSEFTPVELRPDAAELLYIGELREAKGVDTLIDAVARLRARGRSGLRLNVVGSGPDRAAFEQHVARLGLLDAIAFLGPLPARTAFGRGELLIVPSRQESLPYIVLEAAAAAKPIVATSVGGVPEIFGPVAHRLIGPDNVETLASAIEAALNEEPPEREAWTRRLQEHVAHRFSVSAMTDSALAAYNQALSRRQAAPELPQARLRAQG